VLFTIKNLDKSIFVNKNWSNDNKIGCKALSCLVNLIEIDVNLEEDLMEFEGAFERHEVMKF
jgi:hypothetical protein